VVANGRDLSFDFLAPAGASIAGTPFSRAEGRLRVTDDRVITENLHLERGDTSVTVTGQIWWKPHVQIAVEGAEALVDGRRFWIDDPGELSYREHVLMTPGLRVKTPRGEFQVSGDWDTKSHDLNIVCRVDDLDYSVFFPPEEPPSLLIGSASGEFSLAGAAPLLDANADLLLRGIGWERGEFDSLSVVFRMQDRRIDVERLSVWLGRGNLDVAGSLVLPRPLYRTLEALAVGPDLDPAEMHWDLSVTTTDMNLKRWFTFFAPPVRPSGELNLTLDVQGTSAQPRLHFAGRGEKMVWHGFVADRVEFGGGLETGTLSLERFQVWQDEALVEVTGTAPLDLSLTPLAWEFPEREMNLSLVANPGDLGNLKLTPWVSEAEGGVDAEVRIYGTPHRVLMDGEATVATGTLWPQDRDEVLTEVAASIRFEGDLVKVENARAWMERGTVTAQGTYRLGAMEEDSYELIILADKAVVRQEGEYAAMVSGRLTLTPLRAKDGRIYPYAEGKVFAHRVEYAGSLQPQDVGRFEPPSLLYQVRVEAPSKILVRTEGTEGELGGELTARQDVDGRSVLGELEILRGSYKFFLKDFRVQEGTLLWDTPTTLLPVMDITAETAESFYLIVAEITGRPDEPVIRLTAYRDGVDAGLPQDAIHHLIAAGAIGLDPSTAGVRVPGEEELGGIGTEQRVLVGAGQLFTDPLEREIARQLGIGTDIELSTEGAGQDAQARLGVRSYVTPELTVQVRQGLGSFLDQDVSREYRLRRALFLRGEVARRQTKGRKSIVEEYNLDLRFRHEY
jgi:autotransporter translocation and assembly factor TamB